MCCRKPHEWDRNASERLRERDYFDRLVKFLSKFSLASPATALSTAAIAVHSAGVRHDIVSSTADQACAASPVLKIPTVYRADSEYRGHSTFLFPNFDRDFVVPSIVV